MIGLTLMIIGGIILYISLLGFVGRLVYCLIDDQEFGDAIIAIAILLILIGAFVGVVELAIGG